MGINATVTPNPYLSDSMTRANSTDFNFNANAYILNRKPDFLVYIHTISDRNYEVYRPPILKRFTIIGKNPKDKYAKCASFPHPMNVPDASVDSSEIGLKQMDARRFVMDIINPDNLGFDQDAVISNVTSIGNNLGEKGVFWSLNEIPTDAEIAAAKARMEKYYRKLVERANTVHSSSPKDLADTLTPEHLSAAEYLEENFGMQFAWHAKMTRLENCDLCGEKTKSGVAFHRMEDGGICVRDWERAVKAGARTRADAYEATGDEKFSPRAPKTTAPAVPKAVVPMEEEL
jgi:hypothetical protein